MPHFDAMIQQKQKLREAILKNQKVCDLLVNTAITWRISTMLS